jgi:hypothetical protein
LATTLSEVVDLFLTRVNDYRLTAIYTTSGSFTLSTYVEPWLLDSIVEFSVCNQSLNYVSSSGSTVEGYFTEDLSLKNKIILSQIMVKYWLQKLVQDVLQMNNNVQDHDFKTFAQSSNLKAKQDYLNSKKEEISQILVDYGYDNNDWDNWKNGLWVV